LRPNRNNSPSTVSGCRVIDEGL